MPKLSVLYAEQTHEYQFTNYATIGRSSHCTVGIKDIKLSRIHCEIVQDDADFILVDLHSQNGTRVNEQLVLETILKPGDKIQVGRAEITFHA